jgi:replicative DNA helicase
VSAQFRRAGTPLRLVVIDYAQIVSAGGESKRKGENREQEVAIVGRESKKMAKELDAAVILLAQLNDDSAKEKRKPRVKDLRESKALLQDANAVVLIHNPHAIARAEAYANGGGAPADPNDADEVDLIVGKVRHGAPGTLRALYWPTYTAFGSIQYGAGGAS